MAAQNLENCRVRVEAIDVKGAAEFSAALSELGVHIVNRSPDLTVTLVNDYLDRQLAELNQQRVSERAPWLLVQPSGAFPLVGPVFTPGDGACWTCLFDRMIRNREIKGFLDRGPARPVAVSPLSRNSRRAERHPIRGAGSRQGDRNRLSHRVERSHHQPRFAGRQPGEALRGDPPAMPDLRQPRNCATRAGRRRRSRSPAAPSW